MSIRELDDAEDEDWYDHDLEAADASAPCPECGQAVYPEAGKCAACGYWLSEADRRAMWAGERKPAWVVLTAVVLLIVLLFSIAIGVF